MATEYAFCNREKEREDLKYRIEAHEHAVLVAPRRYGKTSLITRVLKENDFPGVSVDLFFVLTQDDIVKTLTEGVAKIIMVLLPKHQTTCRKLIDSVVALNPKITFNLLGQKLEITTKQTTEKSISELLLVLDQFAEKVKKTVCLFLMNFNKLVN